MNPSNIGGGSGRFRLYESRNYGRDNVMGMIKITVLKRALNQELAEAYSNTVIEPCPFFQEGQVFTANPFQKPQNFCDWAWNDIYKVVLTLARGGEFHEEGAFAGWMKDNQSMVVCCTDGIRPVSFLLQRVEE
jgi:uncharacterized repeat protein (TIGR04076 family)